LVFSEFVDGFPGTAILDLAFLTLGERNRIASRELEFKILPKQAVNRTGRRGAGR
jgi:hypothetical protein